MNDDMTKEEVGYLTNMPPLGENAYIEVDTDGGVMSIDLYTGVADNMREIAWSAPDAESADVIWLARAAAAFYHIPCNLSEAVKAL